MQAQGSGDRGKRGSTQAPDRPIRLCAYAHLAQRIYVTNVWTPAEERDLGENKTSQAEKPPRKRVQAAELYFKYIKVE